MDPDTATDELVDLAHEVHDLTGQTSKRPEALAALARISELVDGLTAWLERGGFQ